MFKVENPILIRKGNKDLYKYVTVLKRVDEIIPDTDILANHVRTKIAIK